MIALTVLVLVLAVLVLVCLFALMDHHRTLEEVRDHLGTGDAPRPLTHPVGPIPTTAVGLPRWVEEAEHAVVLFLSTTCATCATVARGFGRGPHPDLHVVVRTPTTAVGTQWCAEVGLPADLVTLATDDGIADVFDLRVTPAGFVLRRGGIAVAQTVPSPTQLRALLDQRALLASTPAPAAAPTSATDPHTAPADGGRSWITT